MLVSVLVCALAITTTAQTVLPAGKGNALTCVLLIFYHLVPFCCSPVLSIPGTLAVSPSPSLSNAPMRSPRTTPFRADDYPSYWTVGLWGPSSSPTDSASPRSPAVVSSLASPYVNPFAGGPSRLLSSSPSAFGPSAAPAGSRRVLPSLASSPFTEAHTESQSVPGTSPSASPSGLVSAFSVAQSSPGGSPTAQDASTALSGSASSLTQTAPAVAGPAVSSVPPPSVAVSPGLSPGTATVVVKPGPAPAPGPAPRVSPGAAASAPGPMSYAQSPRNPFERSSRVQTSSLPYSPQGLHVPAAPSVLCVNLVPTSLSDGYGSGPLPPIPGPLTLSFSVMLVPAMQSV